MYLHYLLKDRLIFLQENKKYVFIKIGAKIDRGSNFQSSAKSEFQQIREVQKLVGKKNIHKLVFEEICWLRQTVQYHLY